MRVRARANPRGCTPPLPRPVSVGCAAQIKATIDAIAVKEKREGDSRAVWHIRSGKEHLLNPAATDLTVQRAVPESMLPELARFVATGGTQGRESMVMEFASTHPQPSKRQIGRTIDKLSVKEKRGDDTAPKWYIRDE